MHFLHPCVHFVQEDWHREDPRLVRSMSWCSGDTRPEDASNPLLPLTSTPNAVSPESSEAAAEVAELVEEMPEENEEDVQNAAGATGTVGTLGGTTGAQHIAGLCNPCVYFASLRGCPWPACMFCHLRHGGAAEKRRPRKQTRDAYKEKVVEIWEQQVRDLETTDQLYDGLVFAAKQIASEVHW